MKHGSITIWMWENKTRWYEAEIYLDLLGDLLLIQRWGGIHNALKGKKINILQNLEMGAEYLSQLHKKRKKRKNPYTLKIVKSKINKLS